MKEADTRVKKIDPRLHEAGWDEGHIIREYPIAPGRIERIKHSHPKQADYLLCYNNKALAVVEAKSDEHPYNEGVEQVKEYARMLQKRFAYATNGDEIYFIDMGVRDAQGNYSHPSHEGLVSRFHTPEELWRMMYPFENTWRDRFNALAFNRDGNRSPRYYQENAINNVLDAVADQRRRILLTMATGTGKTYVAFQICWKLFKTYWNKDNQPDRQPRILFIADRNILANQAKNDFEYFPEDAMTRLTPDVLRKNDHKAPLSRSLYFTIFQTFMCRPAEDANPYYMQYPKNFFDFIIIDECHRGGANDESEWRELLDWFDSAYQLGLTATPQRKVNANTYRYFGEPVYTYSLKQGIADGYLTPFRVRISTSPIDEYRYNDHDDVEGEIDHDRVYTEEDFYQGKIEVKGRDENRVRELLAQMNPDEKTIVFCATQLHAMIVRDFINQHKRVPDNNYCERVTADDGDEGEKKLRLFQDNENLRPTILTTSQKLSTGVDARNVRNIVLMRPVNNMVEFKQIIGRGTRMFDDKYFFTIYDFVGASRNFQDEEWDGDPFCPVCGNYPCSCNKGHRPPTPGKICKVCGQSPCVCPSDPVDPQPCPVCGQLPCVCEPAQKNKIIVRLSDKRKIELFNTTWSDRFMYGDELISIEDFIARLFGRLPEFFSDQDDLRRQWANPETREALLERLGENGFSEEKLEMLRTMLQMQNCDLLDVLEYIGFETPGLARVERANLVREQFIPQMATEQQVFFNFILDYYVRNGYKELGKDNLSKLIMQKYESTADAIRLMKMKPNELRDRYFDLQTQLYYLTKSVPQVHYHIDHLHTNEVHIGNGGVLNAGQVL